MNYNEAVLSKGIIFLQPTNPFTWSSGIKSPIYCDNRLTLAYPELRSYIATQLISMIKQYYPTCEVVMGTSTAGIPHATLVADKMNLPAGYVRGDAKKHGRTNQIEGAPVAGKNVVVVEDLISTGKSVEAVLEALIENGANVLGVVSIFQYNMKKASEMFGRYNLTWHSISDIHELLAYASEKSLLSTSEVAQVKRFIENPNDWQSE